MARRTFFFRLKRDRRGISTTEFAILLGLIGLASLQALSAMGKRVSGDFNQTSAKVGTNTTSLLGTPNGAAPNSEPPGGTDENGMELEPSIAGAQMAPEPSVGGLEMAPDTPVIEEPPIAQMKAPSR